MIERFSARAGAYAAHRPGYPPAAIDALFEGLGTPESLTVADIGAGTGIASQLLAERGAKVYAIEPNAAMRAQAAPNPRVKGIDGTGEDSTLAAKSVDIAAAFQAFHWFEPRRAIEEFRRIGRRRIALLQYERDESQAFAAAYAELVRRYAADETEARRFMALVDFTKLAGPSCTRGEYRYAQNLDKEQLLGRIASTSYLPRTGETAEDLRRDAVVLFERFAEDQTVSLAMVCYVLLADA